MRAHKDKYVAKARLRMRDLVAKSGRERAAGGDGTAAGMPLEQGHAALSARRLRCIDDSGHVDTGDIFEFAAKAKLGAEVYAAAATLQGGQVSDPIPQSDGVHVVVMVEHRMPVQEDYAAAADKVWNDFKNDAQAQVREAEVRYLRSRADILLSPEARALEGSAPVIIRVALRCCLAWLLLCGASAQAHTKSETHFGVADRGQRGASVVHHSVARVRRLAQNDEDQPPDARVLDYLSSICQSAAGACPALRPGARWLRPRNFAASK